MATRQSEVDRLTKAHKRRRSTDIGQGGIPMLDRSRRGKGSRPISREPSPGPDPSRNPRVAALHNKWKQVWLMAMDRRRRLQDALDRQAEVSCCIYRTVQSPGMIYLLLKSDFRLFCPWKYQKSCD